MKLLYIWPYHLYINGFATWRIQSWFLQVIVFKEYNNRKCLCLGMSVLIILLICQSRVDLKS